MTKELEALETLFASYNYYGNYQQVIEARETIEKALKRLEAIDNANPSEALESLDKLNKLLNYVNIYKIAKIEKDVNTIKQSLLKAQEQEKVLEIIFEKKVDMYMLNDLGTLEDYNEWVLKKYGTYYQITQEEFNFLKRYCDLKDKSE